MNNSAGDAKSLQESIKSNQRSNYSGNQPVNNSIQEEGQSNQLEDLEEREDDFEW